MRDDRRKWPEVNRTVWPLDVWGAVLSPAAVIRQTLVSGAPESDPPQQPAIAWPGIVRSDESYALQLSRDKRLVVNGPPAPEGWDDTANVARSDASDAYAVFDLRGPRALDLLSSGAELSLAQPSRSAARLLYGLPVILYRCDTEDGFRLHIDSARQDALTRYLSLPF